MKKYFSLLAIACFVLTAAQARITLPAHFTDNMVVQQQSTLKIKGTATPRSTVTLSASWAKAKVTTTADGEGRWTLLIDTPKASRKAYTMTFSDGEELTLSNVLVGEVWLGSGQSNMEMPVVGWGKVLNYEEEVRNANYPMIRLMQVKKATSLRPQEQVTLNMGGWQECSPEYVPNFSALCYFYGLRLWEELGVPIGLIDDDWGGTVAQAWTSIEALDGVQGFQEQMNLIRAADYDEGKIEQMGQDALNRKDKGTVAGWQSATLDDASWPTMQVPGAWENAGLKDFDGIAWMRRTIDIPAGWAGKDLTLSLSNVDDQNIAFWNGEAVGTTGSITTKSRYTIPGRLVKEGRNVLAVRILDTGGNGGITGGKDEIFVQLDDQHRISLADTWHIMASTVLQELPSMPTVKGNPNFPTALYNAMIHPLLDFPIRGVIWYQGCSNVGGDRQYESLFQTMIQDWRHRFGQPKMPFYFVQLANYLAPSDCQPESKWALLRESQEHALCLENTGMAVNIDLGDPRDIHPKTKRELGRRLAAVALHNTYGKKKTPFTAPVYECMTVKGSEAHISFSLPEGSEPLVQEDNLPGFIMAGPDGKWHVAKARTNGEAEVVVTCPDVQYPVAVRYGWADNPTCTLRTKSDLHVAPFRTDKW